MRHLRTARAPHRRRSGRLATRQDQVLRWTLRALVRAGAMRAALRRDGELPAQVLQAVGVDAPADSLPKQVRLRTLVARVTQRLAEVERFDCEPSVCARNAELLAGMLRLGRTEAQLLSLAAALDGDEPLRACFRYLPSSGLPQTVTHLARVLGLRRRDVERALRRGGALRSLCLIELPRADRGGVGPISLTSAADDVLLCPVEDERELLERLLTRPPAPTLTLDDYAHVADDVTLVLRYLRAALERRARGVNVLVHGPPGTGKTELASVLARELGATLDSVALVDEDNDVFAGQARLERYALCQRILRGRRGALLLFDELEDAFSVAGITHKAWTNQLLERNPTPTLWLSNAIDQLDRAYVRRFDIVLELPVPPRGVRARVLRKHLAGLPLPQGTVERMAEHEALSPGHAQRAARVLRLLRPRSEQHAQRDLQRVVEANLRAYTGRRPHTAPHRELSYDLSLLNASVDPARIVAGLQRTGRGTLCFHGPPGTGKSAFAQHIAGELELPLSTHRASTLMSKWLGETEQRIAAMFERAAAEPCVLLLDEADSFLRDRRGAHRSWEVTQVNEMLTQMEHFQGIFVCSTNLMEQLDQAALRRFAIKVRFDYLRAAQVQLLLERTLVELGCAFGAAELERAGRELRRLRRLTPGDFASVARRMRTLGERPSPGELVCTLAEEHALKQEGRARALGFAR